MKAKSYTSAEASAVAKVPLKAVHKAIDGRLVRPHRTRRGHRIQRLLSAEHLVYLRLEAEGVRLLPLKSRRELARALESAPGADAVTVSGGSALLVQVKQARKDVERELKRLHKAGQMAVSDPGIMRGIPVYKGTRIPINLVAEMMAQGATVEEILEGYPALGREQVELAPLYAAAFPRRGRPVRRPWQQEKPVDVTRYRRGAGAR